MLHDEDIFPQPNEFRPERYLGDDDTPLDRTRDPSVLAFGFGRRYADKAVTLDQVPHISLGFVSASIMQTKLYSLASRLGCGRSTSNRLLMSRGIRCYLLLTNGLMQELWCKHSV